MNIVGHCPKCGAPIWTESVWMSVSPPPSYFTCACNPGARIQTVTSTNIKIANKDEEVKCRND